MKFCASTTECQGAVFLTRCHGHCHARGTHERLSDCNQWALLQCLVNRSVDGL